jgi:hypothetical protein
MKNLYYYSLFFGLLTISNGNWLGGNDNNNIRSISTSSMLGKCRGYFRRSINITSIPLQAVASNEPNYEQIEYSPSQCLYSFSSSQYWELVILVDSAKFKSLDDHVFILNIYFFDIFPFDLFPAHSDIKLWFQHCTI